MISKAVIIKQLELSVDKINRKLKGLSHLEPFIQMKNTIETQKSLTIDGSVVEVKAADKY